MTRQEQAHTPGPAVIGDGVSDYGEVIRGPNKEYVARVGQNLREKKSNARLRDSVRGSARARGDMARA